jgi:hypothetical protein
VILTIIWWWQKLWEYVSKGTKQKFDMKSFNLKKLNGVEDKEQYRVKISNRFSALENSDDDVDINKAWETVIKNT